MVSPRDDTVLDWIRAFQNGERQAAQQLWDAYFERLMTLALGQLRKRGSKNPAREDCEDVAISAFAGFCQAALAGRFPRLEDRDDLWRVLVVITRRKAAALLERESRAKRGGAWKRADSLLEDVPGREVGPDETAVAADLYHTLFVRLDDDGLRAAAELRLKGWTVAEIAESLGCSVPTVERRLRSVRQEAEKLW
jgi:RNA polymerase sigma factor (sigma-70 family)